MASDDGTAPEGGDATATPKATPTRRAVVVGTGLIGASIGLALRSQGWHVTGRDTDSSRLDAAVDLGAIDAVGEDPAAEITFVATPVAAVADEIRHALGTTAGLVTDVASVKSPLVDLMGDPRYVGGHPMAGSEQEGLGGARADLFMGATWVLTPLPGTDDEAFAAVRAVVKSFGAEVVALAPDQHDRMVAVVSHVPHLAAATLMSLADERSDEHRALLRLAAGGFRDMTRVASGQPAIWPDICAENRTAIVDVLGSFIDELTAVRDVVAAGDRAALMQRLELARAARRNLPTRLAAADNLVEIRLPIADEAGALSRVLLLAAELGVSVADVEIAHSVEGDGGVLVLVVEAEPAGRLVAALEQRGSHPAVVPLS
jgi:prephenate dehydrogenase